VYPSKRLYQLILIGLILGGGFAISIYGPLYQIAEARWAWVIALVLATFSERGDPLGSTRGSRASGMARGDAHRAVGRSHLVRFRQSEAPG